MGTQKNEKVLDDKKPAASTDKTVETVEFKFKVKKVVTVPVLQLKLDLPYYVRVDSAIYIGKDIKESKESAVKKEPAHLMNVMDLSTKEEKLIVMNTVLCSILEETYPDESYVGKCFEIVKHAKKSGKEYHTFSVREIEVE